MTMLNLPYLQNEDAARKYLEDARWPDGPVCPHCGSIDRAYARKKPGVYRCAEKECRKDFTVTTKSVMESSHVPLHLWLQAFYLMCASKKGISALQVSRTLKITYKSAWFLCHRIREAMRSGGLVTPMGGNGGIVEADETYFGNVEKAKRRTKTTSGRTFTKSGRPGPSNKRAIVSLVERGGRVRSFHVPTADKESVTAIVRENIARETRLHTDESRLYFGSNEYFDDHETVTHSRKEYVRGDVHTNSVEGYFSIFKRGMKGVYQHCSEKHLHRYLAEFDFRYNNRIALGTDDGERATLAVMGAAGKRLTYRQPHEA
jgi:transposase-like protein